MQDLIRHVLADSANMFSEYPDATPFTCELMEGLNEAMADDSVRYHFEHLSQRYWLSDPHYGSVEHYIDGTWTSTWRSPPPATSLRICASWG